MISERFRGHSKDPPTCSSKWAVRPGNLTAKHLPIDIQIIACNKRKTVILSRCPDPLH